MKHNIEGHEFEVICLGSCAHEKSDYSISMWLDRNDAFDIITRLTNGLRDSEKKEVNFNLFMKRDVEGEK